VGVPEGKQSANGICDKFIGNALWIYATVQFEIMIIMNRQA
jgi:hypothetical protein